MKHKYRVAIVVVMAVLIAAIALSAAYKIDSTAYDINWKGERVRRVSISSTERQRIELYKAIILGTSVLIIGGLFLYILREEKEGGQRKMKKETGARKKESF